MASHAVNYAAKLAVMGVAVFFLLEYPGMPGVLHSFCLSERWQGPPTAAAAWLLRPGRAPRAAYRQLCGLPRPAVAWGLYALLSSIMDGPAVLLVGLLGMKLSPHFDKVRRHALLCACMGSRQRVPLGRQPRAA